MSELLDLPLSAITESATNPRKHFNPARMAELVASIKAQGVLQPILVRPLPGHRVAETHRGVTHEIIAGARRFRASTQAGLASIMAVVSHLDDNAAMEAAILENLQRDDLTELEEAEGYDALMQHNKISADQVGGKIGKSRSYVYGRLKLLDLTFDAKKALREGAIEASHALLIARIPDFALQLKALAQATDTSRGHGPSLRDFQAWLRQHLMLDLAKATFDITDCSLTPNAGACTSCPKRTGANPDLFTDVGSADICTDPPCYQAKTEAERLAARARYQAQGITVIDGDDAERLHQYLDHFSGYTRTSQTREDTASGEPATLLDLLGTQGQQEVGVVAIEHPNNRTLLTYVDRAKAEAYLESHGLVKVAGGGNAHKAHLDPENRLVNLLAARERRVDIAGENAVKMAVQQAVLKAPARIISTNLLTDHFLRSYLIATSNPYNPGVLAAAMDCEFESKSTAQVYEAQLSASIYKAERSTLLRAFILVLLETMQDDADDEDDELLAVAEDLYDTLSNDLPTLADIRSAAEAAETAVFDAEAAELQAQIDAAKPAKTPTPKTPLAQPNNTRAGRPAGAGAKPARSPPNKPKLSALAAQSGIAEAMQAIEGAPATGTPPHPVGSQPQADQPATDGPVAQGPVITLKAKKRTVVPQVEEQADSLPTSIEGGLAVGQRVKILGHVGIRHSKWIGKQGTITASMGDTAWDVTFRGRNGGLASFNAGEIEVVSA